MSQNLSIKTLARKLRYRSLPNLISKTVTVNSISTVETDIHQGLGSMFPSEARLIGPQDKFIQGALGKYGLLDLTFQVPDIWLASEYESGIRLLRRFHFAAEAHQTQKLKNEAEKLSEFEDPTCLVSLQEDLDKDITVFLLFLTSDRIEGEGPHRLGIIPPDYLPRVFTIIDACITNTGYIWFWKHFYF